MNFSNLKNKLKSESSIENIFDVLIKIISHNSSKKTQTHAYSTNYQLYKDENRKNLIDYDKFDAKRSKLLFAIFDLIDSLDETDLVERWEEADGLIIFFGLEDREEITEDDQLLDISESIDSDIVLTDFDIESNSYPELSLLLLKCQDALGIEELDEAEKYALAAKEIDSTSPQIYEYLARISYMRTSPGAIIKQAVQGNSQFLKKILQYVKRYHQFENRFLGNSQEKAQQHIKLIGRELAYAIKNQYKDHEDLNRLSLWKLLQFYKGIYEQMLMPHPFLEIAILELSNGGKIDWLKVEAGQIRNKKQQYVATGLRKDFIEKLTTLIETQQNISYEEASLIALKRIKENFYFRNIHKYRRIQKERDKDTGKFYWTQQKRKEVIQILETSKIGFLLYGDIKFLEIPLNEITGKGHMSWFELSIEGELKVTHHLDGKKNNFDPLAELGFYCEKLGQNLEDEKANIRKDLITNLDDRIKGDFRRLKILAKAKDNADLQWIKEQVYRTLALTKLLVEQKMGKPELTAKLIARSLKELTGGGICSEWIIITENGQLKNEEIGERQGYDALEIFEFLLIRSLSYEIKPLYKGSKKEFLDQLKSSVSNFYINLPDDIEPKNSPHELRNEIIQLFPTIEILFYLTSEITLLQMMHKEITGGGKFLWIHEVEGELKNLSVAEFLKFDAVAMLNKINQLFKEFDFQSSLEEMVSETEKNIDKVGTKDSIDFNQMMHDAIEKD